MIRVQCLSPKRLKGEHNFAGYEEFALWVIVNIRGGKTKVGRMLSAVGGKGELITTNIGCDIHATGEFFIKNYLEFDKLKRQTRLIKKRGFADYYSKNPEVAINFARELDKLAKSP